MRLFLGASGTANQNLFNASIPAFEAFKAVSTPIAGFNTPTINEEYPEYDKVISTLMGKATSNLKEEKMREKTSESTSTTESGSLPIM